MSKRNEGILECVELARREHSRQMAEDEGWEELKKQFYGTDFTVQWNQGVTDFSPNGIQDVVNGEGLHYDEYLDIMRASIGRVRQYFECCYYNAADCFFKGQIERKSRGNICFKRIHISALHEDGTGHEHKEDHVWMPEKGFESYSTGDSLSFQAEIYRYLKTGNGKTIDYALRNPSCIKQVDSYELPSDDDILMESIDNLICEACLYNEQCYRFFCIANEEWVESMKSMLYEALRD